VPFHSSLVGDRVSWEIIIFPRTTDLPRPWLRSILPVRSVSPFRAGSPSTRADGQPGGVVAATRMSCVRFVCLGGLPAFVQPTAAAAIRSFVLRRSFSIAESFKLPVPSTSFRGKSTCRLNRVRLPRVERVEGGSSAQASCALYRIAFTAFRVDRLSGPACARGYGGRCETGGQ